MLLKVRLLNLPQVEGTCLWCSKGAVIGTGKTHRNIIYREAFYLGAGCIPIALFKGVLLMDVTQPPVVFCKKIVRKNFGILTEKHLSWSLFNEEGLQVY